MSSGEEILKDLWRFTAVHPEWEEGEDWDAEVAWWAVRGSDGLTLIDPLVEDWEELDDLVQAGGGCAGIVRTLHFHERSIPETAARYGAQISTEAPLPGGIAATPLVRDDEIALWLPDQRALAFGDAMLRAPDGRLTMCPESWVARVGGRARLRQHLEPLRELGPDHVLVSHGPLVLGDGSAALAAALADPR
jgi:glyoxylase-like metal-dependent hydrolase (beta-lactamase superfamily II)